MKVRIAPLSLRRAVSRQVLTHASPSSWNL
jgi:hypothetical protein